MLIYDRRRCRPLAAPEQLKRLTPRQRSQLAQLELEGWRLAFVRGEAASAFVRHPAHGDGVLVRDGRLVMLQALPVRQDDPVPHAVPPPSARRESPVARVGA